MAFGQLGQNPTSQNFMVNILNKKSVVCKNFWCFFTKLSPPKIQFWTEPNSSLRLGLQSFLLSYSQLCHHCYFWQFLFNELLQWLFRLNHLASKNKLIWEFLWFFDLVVIHPWQGPCHMGRAVPASVAATLN